MDTACQREEKECSGTKAISPSATGITGAAQQDADGQKSWGDKYKEKTFGFLRNILLNYVVNFGISALFTYKVMKSDWGKKHFGENIQGGNTVERFAQRVKEKTGIASGLTNFVTRYFTITQLLMFGGHAILPLMKYSHDHKKSMEFLIGHRLDQMQTFMGQGNAATKRRLEEYKVITDIFKSRPHELTDKEKELLAKNCIGDNLQFDERPIGWGPVLKARLGGVAATTTLGVTLGVASGAKVPWLNFDKFAENKAGKAIGEKVLKPVMGSYIDDPNTLGKYAFIEMLYTAASKMGFDRIERRHIQKQHEEEMAAAAAALKRDEKSLTQLGGDPATPQPAAQFTAQAGRTSGLDARRKILEEGEKDFRARESAKTGGSAIAIS